MIEDQQGSPEGTGPMEPGLQSALDAVTTSSAREDFRAQLRQRFLRAAGRTRADVSESRSFGAGVWDTEPQEPASHQASVQEEQTAGREPSVPQEQAPKDAQPLKFGTIRNAPRAIEPNSVGAISREGDSDLVTDEDSASKLDTVKQVEMMLGAVAPSQAREAFRQELRSRFMTAAVEPLAAPLEVQPSDEQPLDAQLDGGQGAPDGPVSREDEADSDALEAPVVGELAEAESAGGPLAAMPADAPPPAETEAQAQGADRPENSGLRPVRSTRPRAERSPVAARRPRAVAPQARRPWGLVGGGLAAAAAVVLMLVLFRPGDEASWQAVATAGIQPSFRVDGAAYQPEQGLDDVQTVTSGEQSVRLQFGEDLIVELGPNSSLDLSEARGEGDLILAMAGEEGGFRVATLPGFREAGRRLTFRTPDADVEVLGTVFGVDRYGKGGTSAPGTCVCCTRGEVEVHSRRNDETPMAIAASAANADPRQFVFSGDGTTNGGAMIPDHEAPLLALMASLQQ